MDNLPGYPQAPQILLLRFMPGSHRLGGGVYADAIMDRIVLNAVWVETGSMNMREFFSKRNGFLASQPVSGVTLRISGIFREYCWYGA